MGIARFLTLYRQNLAAPGPVDPVEAYKMNGQIFAGVEEPDQSVTKRRRFRDDGRRTMSPL